MGDGPSGSAAPAPAQRSGPPSGSAAPASKPAPVAALAGPAQTLQLPALWNDGACIYCGKDDWVPGDTPQPRTMVHCSCCEARCCHVACHQKATADPDDEFATASGDWFCSQVSPAAHASKQTAMLSTGPGQRHCAGSAASPVLAPPCGLYAKGAHGQASPDANPLPCCHCLTPVLSALSSLLVCAQDCFQVRVPLRLQQQ